MGAVHEITLPIKLTTTAVVGPGEKLMVGISEPISLEQHRWMTGLLAETLPGVEVVVIDRCSSLAVYRDDSSEHPALQAIRARLDNSDEALSAAWLRKVIG